MVYMNDLTAAGYLNFPSKPVNNSSSSRAFSGNRFSMIFFNCGDMRSVPKLSHAIVFESILSKTALINAS